MRYSWEDSRDVSALLRKPKRTMIEFVIRVPDEVGTLVRGLKEWISAMEIVSETTCREVTKVEVNTGTTSADSVLLSGESCISKFVGKCKDVARKIGELNGEKMTYTPKGKSIEYTFHFDAEGFCDMMDDLCKDYSEDIDDYLSKVQAPDGISIVLPFVGKILSDYIFSTQQSLHKSSLIDKLKEIYDSDYIEKYLSYDGRKRKQQLDDLFKLAVKIACNKQQKD